MNIRIVLAFFIGFTILFFGCKESGTKKEDSSKDIAPQPDIKRLKNTFSVLLEVQLDKNDALEVFYLKDEMDTYKAEQMIQRKTNGMNDFQEVVFELPKEVYPYNIRLDFGSNNQQGQMKIKKCVLAYNKGSMEIKGSELKKFFNFNGGIEMQSDSLTITFKPFDLNGKEVYDPYMVGNKNLEMALTTKI